MEHHETELPQDRARRYRRQTKAREQELAAQTEELQQEGRSRLRDQKAREAAEAAGGLEIDDPRAQQGERRPPVGETGE